MVKHLLPKKLVPKLCYITNLALWLLTLSSNRSNIPTDLSSSSVSRLNSTRRQTLSNEVDSRPSLRAYVSPNSRASILVVELENCFIRPGAPATAISDLWSPGQTFTCRAYPRGPTVRQHRYVDKIFPKQPGRLSSLDSHLV